MGTDSALLSNGVSPLLRILPTCLLLLLASACPKKTKESSREKETAAQSCPTKEGTVLNGVEVFDGDPAELASLVPDENGSERGMWNVAYVYEAKRNVWLRCKYGNGSVQDLRFPQPVKQCNYSRDKAGQLTASCR
jgi:hypothetical protein